MIIQQVSLKEYCSLRIGGDVEMVTVSKTAELIQAVMYAKQQGKHVHILGEGTNTFFGNDLQNIFCIRMMIKGISFEAKGQDIYITSYAGEVWDDVVRFSVEKGLWGVENLSYIPGTVGAAPVQNIGAYGVELKDVFVSLSALDVETLDIVEVSRDACHFGYRDSLFKRSNGRYIIISVTLKLSSSRTPVFTYKPLDTLLLNKDCTVQEVRDLVVSTRKHKLPDYKQHPNAGSFFKNPIVTSAQGEALRAQYGELPLILHPEGYKIPAAWLIEHVVNMKGVRVGDVGTWPNQPLVLVNYGKARVEDILAFSDEIIQKIQEKTGILLEKEVNCVT